MLTGAPTAFERQINQDQFDGKNCKRQHHPFPTTPSAFTEWAMCMPYKGDLSPFSFEGREYLKTIYDSQAQRILLLLSFLP